MGREELQAAVRDAQTLAADLSAAVELCARVRESARAAGLHMASLTAGSLEEHVGASARIATTLAEALEEGQAEGR